MGCTAQSWSRHLFARARLEPLEPVGPPTAIVMLGALKPLVCTLHGLIVHPVTSPFARGIDNTGNMPTPTQGKTRFSPDKPGDAPCRLPGYDMILLCANSVDILLNLAKVNRHSFQDNFIGLDQIVLQVGVAQVERVRFTSHARAVVVPVEQVEGGWLLA